jgi:hypothetical protein
MSNESELMIREVYAYLRLHDTAAAIDFYARAFGAKELFRLVEPSGRVGHAEVKIGPVTIMLSDEYPEMGIRGPRSIGATTVTIHIHVSDVERWLRARPSCDRCRISSMASAPARCATRSDTNGCSADIWKI